MQVPTWRNVLNLKNVLVPSVSGTRIAAIHSTPVNFEKWKSKRNDDAKKEQKPSKNHIRYAVRQKRADTKRALRGLVYDYGSCKPFQQGGVPRMSSFNSENLDSTAKTRRPKNPAKSAKKSYQKKIKRKFRRDYFSEDEDDPATVFHARFGKKWFTWSFHHSSFRGTTSEFEWTEPPNWSKFKAREWDTTGDAESDNSDDDEPCSVGSTSDRTILGLPPTGPLKIDEVKTAFRLSALKWHPDKHQGPSQATAEEKFKLCVNAYKSLCSALS